MPRPLSGSILTRRLADDTLVVDVKIRNKLRTLGPASEWSEKRARRLLEYRLLPAARLRTGLLAAELDEDEWRLLRRYGQRGGRSTMLDPGANGVVSPSSRG